MDKKNDQSTENTPENRGRGETLVYSRTTRRDAAVDLLTAYKWPIVIAISIVIVLLALGIVPIPGPGDLPPEFWSGVFYFTVGLAPGAPIAWYLYNRWYSVEGQEAWDHDPVTDDHRHIRLGTELWDDLVVLSPWGEVVGRGALQNCQINGRPGHEMMDFRVRDDGTPVCVATMMGEASHSMIRTYRQAIIYTRRRLSQQANRALMEEANREPIAREVAMRVNRWMIRTAERSGTPGAHEIENVVQDVLGDMGMADPLANDDLEGIEEWTPGADRDDDGGGDQLGNGEVEADPFASNGGGPR